MLSTSPYEEDSGSEADAETAWDTNLAASLSGPVEAPNLLLNESSNSSNTMLPAQTADSAPAGIDGPGFVRLPFGFGEWKSVRVDFVANFSAENIPDDVKMRLAHYPKAAQGRESYTGTRFAYENEINRQLLALNAGNPWFADLKKQERMSLLESFHKLDIGKALKPSGRHSLSKTKRPADSDLGESARRRQKSDDERHSGGAKAKKTSSTTKRAAERPRSSSMLAASTKNAIALSASDLRQRSATSLPTLLRGISTPSIPGSTSSAPELPLYYDDGFVDRSTAEFLWERIAMQSLHGLQEPQYSVNEPKPGPPPLFAYPPAITNLHSVADSSMQPALFAQPDPPIPLIQAPYSQPNPPRPSFPAPYGTVDPSQIAFGAFQPAPQVEESHQQLLGLVAATVRGNDGRPPFNNFGQSSVNLSGGMRSEQPGYGIPSVANGAVFLDPPGAEIAMQQQALGTFPLSNSFDAPSFLPTWTAPEPAIPPTRKQPLSLRSPLSKEKYVNDYFAQLANPNPNLTSGMLPNAVAGMRISSTISNASASTSASKLQNMFDRFVEENEGT